MKIKNIQPRLRGRYASKKPRQIVMTFMALASISAISYLFRYEPLLSPCDPSGCHAEPIVIASPVMAKEPEASTIIDKTTTKSWEIYQLIRRYESSNGTKGLAVTCKNKGMVNEVGWKAHQRYCFRSEEEQEITIMQYFQKRLNVLGWTVSEAMCYYNTGKKQKSCAYSIGNLVEAN
jgi:hypothetical protein